MGLIKKFVVASAVATGLAATAAGIASTKFGNYVSYRAERAFERVEAAIPMESQIGQIKREVANLDKDIDRAKGTLAEQIVAERQQKEAVDNLARSTEKQEAFVRKQAESLKDAKEGDRVKWDGYTVSFGKARERLEADVARLKANRRELEAQKQMMATHEKSRMILEQQLHAMIAQKSDMKAAVADLESQVRLVKLQQIESRYQNDGSRLAEIKESMRELQTRVEVQRERLKLADSYGPEEAAGTRSVDEILAGLDGKAEKAEKTSTK